MMTEAQLQARDAKRDIGAELIEAAKELRAHKAARTTTFEPLADGSMRRTVTLADGTVQSTEVLTAPQWQLLNARSQAGLSQAEFARATGVSVRTLQEWEQGRREPSGAARTLLRIALRSPEAILQVG
jgi:putative transcriptional regulator